MARLLVLLLCAAVLLPAAASAQTTPPQTNAPPGNSAIDEYLETVPGTTGDSQPRPPGQAPSGVLTPEQREQLNQLGADGRAVQRVVDATAPAPGRRAAGEGQAAVAAKHAESDLPPGDDKSRSALNATIAAALGPNDGGGLGILLPVILVASLVGTVALSIRRRLKTT